MIEDEFVDEKGRQSMKMCMVENGAKVEDFKIEKEGEMAD